jgi:hypothetical protein
MSITSRSSREHAPAARHLHALDRRLIARIVVARQYEIAVERAGSDTAERHQRVRLAADIGRHLLQAQHVETIGQGAQGVDQRGAGRAHCGRVHCGVAGEDRRVVVGDAEIGKLDDADAAPGVADHRHHRDLLAGRGIGDHGDQRRDAVKRLVPGTKPVTMLERGAMARVQAQRSPSPVTHEID